MDNDKIGAFLKKLRDEKKLSQDELANLLFMNRSNISRWESGKTQVPLDKLKILSEIYNVSLDELISGERITTRNKMNHSNIMFDFLIKKDNYIKKIKTVCFIILYYFFLFYYIIFLKLIILNLYIK